MPDATDLIGRFELTRTYALWEGLFLGPMDNGRREADRLCSGSFLRASIHQVSQEPLGYQLHINHQVTLQDFNAGPSLRITRRDWGPWSASERWSTPQLTQHDRIAEQDGMVDFPHQFLPRHASFGL